MIIRGQKSIGMSAARPAPVTLPPGSISPDEILQDLALRLVNLETLVERKADSDRLRSLIAISPEAIKLQARDIVLAGTVTIVDVFNDYNGTATGVVPARLTRIRGDIIQTGTLKGNSFGPSAGSAWDLDNDIMVMGGTENPKFLFDGEDLEIAGTIRAGSIIAESVTVGGVQLGTIKSNAATGATHAGQTGNVHNVSLSQISGDLDDIGDGSTYYRSTFNQVVGGGRAYNALDSSYDYIRAISTQKIVISGSNPSNGIVFDVSGLRAYQAASPTLVINAATGSSTWSGDIETAGRVIATGGETVSGVLAAMHAIAGTIGGTGLYARQNIGTTAVGAEATTGWAMLGIASSSGGLGAEGRSTSAAGFGVRAQNTADGVALDVPAGYINKPRVTDHLLDVWDYSTGTFAGTFEFRFRKA